MAGYGGASCCDENFCNDVRFGQPRVVLDEGLKDIYEQLYRVDLLRAYSQLVIRLLRDEVHEPKSAFLEFMDLSDTNYKFMDLKMHFHTLWT